jgi:hypothetical protein
LCFQVGIAALALAVVTRSTRRGIRVWLIPVCALAGALPLLNWLVTRTGLQTSSPLLNLLFPAAALVASFVAYCILAMAAWSIRPLFVGIAAGTVACAPLIVLVRWFPQIVFVGGLMVDDDLRAPLYTAEIRPGVSCEGTEWGYYTTGFHGVALYRYVPGFPFVRVEVARRSEQETGADYYWPPNRTGCAKLAAEVHLESGSYKLGGRHGLTRAAPLR